MFGLKYLLRKTLFEFPIRTVTTTGRTKMETEKTITTAIQFYKNPKTGAKT